MKAREAYWFPARQQGWGWGLPSARHGWIVLYAYGVCLLVNMWLSPPWRDPFSFVLGVVLASAILFIVCWLKGEPPRWRWFRRKRLKE